MNYKRYLHFWEIEGTYLWMEDDFWKIIEHKKSNSWSDVSRKLGINVGTFRNYHSQYTAPNKGQFMPVSVLLRLSELFNIEKKQIEDKKYIMLIKGGQGPSGVPLKLKFPIDFLTEEWAGLVGAFLSEGNMSKDYGVGFCNKDQEVMDNYIEMVRKIVGNGMNVIGSHYICSLPSIIGKTTAVGLGFEPGSKKEANVRIPLVYMNTKNERTKHHLLSWLFTGDGWITLFNDHLGQTHRTIGICFGSKNRNEVPNLLRDAKILLNSSGIRSSAYIFETRKQKSGKTTYSCKIYIKGKRNFVIFQDKINFQSKKKQNILSDSIESFERPKLGNNESLFMIIKSCLELHKAGKDINKHTIAEKTGLNHKWIETQLKTAKERKFLRVIGGGRPISYLSGRAPFIYEPLKSSKKFLEEFE